MALSDEWIRKHVITRCINKCSANKYRLEETRKFADFNFTVNGVAKFQVHTIVFAAHSPVFERFFEGHKVVSQRANTMSILFD